MVGTTADRKTGKKNDTPPAGRVELQEKDLEGVAAAGANKASPLLMYSLATGNHITRG